MLEENENHASCILSVVEKKPDPIKDELDALIKEVEQDASFIGALYTASYTEPYFDKDATGFENLQLFRTGKYKKLKNIAIRPTRKMLYLLLSKALEDRATDVYFELCEREFKFRFVVDGLSYEMFSPPRHLHEKFVEDLEAEFGILKIEEIKAQKSWLDLIFQIVFRNWTKTTSSEPNVTRLREFNDGDFVSAISNGIKFDLMKATSKYGPQYRLKIFRTNEFRNLEELFSTKFLDKEGCGEIHHDSESVEKIRRAVSENGLVLVAGAPNSGRTTTLYHLLEYADRPDKVTVAIGRVYVPDSIHQFLISPTNPNYLNALKAIRNLNPNAVLLDGIEDSETAKEAIRYASSRALVLASVPSNGIISGIEYLLSLGVNSSLLADSLQCAVGQALVRGICYKCKESYKPHKQLIKELKLPENSTYWYGGGCDECSTTGYKDRIPVFQVIGSQDKEMNAIKTQLKEGRSLDGVVPSLKELGKEKILKGLTTIEEVLKI